MTSNLPTVSVVIPARNAANSLPRCLSAVGAQTYDGLIEVIVAAADDGSAAVAGKGGVRVVRNVSGTTPAALNLAIAASTGEVIVRCDAQSILPPTYIERAVDTMIRTGADNVGGMQVPVGETPSERAIAAAMSSRWGAGDARYRVGGDEGPVETVYLGVFKKETLARLGGFDEDFVRNQDYELNHRILASGGTVWFDPELAVTYRPRGTLRSLARQYRDYGRSKRQFGRRHPGSLRPRQLAPPTLVSLLLVCLVASVWWPPAILGPVGYIVGLLFAASPGPAPVLRTALALGTMHISWGLGFLFPGGGEP